jgi:hypothetical protein
MFKIRNYFGTDPKSENCTYRFGFCFKSMSNLSALLAVFLRLKYRSLLFSNKPIEPSLLFILSVITPSLHVVLSIVVMV